MALDGVKSLLEAFMHEIRQAHVQQLLAVTERLDAHAAALATHAERLDAHAAVMAAVATSQEKEDLDEKVVESAGQGEAAADVSTWPEVVCWRPEKAESAEAVAAGEGEAIAIEEDVAKSCEIRRKLFHRISQDFA